MKLGLIRNIAMLSVLAGAAVILSGCNTVGGLGEDLQILGKKMERKADDVYRGVRY